MPYTEKQARFAGAELGRLRKGKKKRSTMTEEQLSAMASYAHGKITAARKRRMA